MWNVQVPHNAWTPALFGSLGLKRSDPSFRCHSKGLAEKFDECARLPIADLGSNRLHSTSLNQQLYSFHQTHLSSPKLEARPNLSAEDSLDCPDACTNFSAQRPERWSVLLICHKGSSNTESSRIVRQCHKCRNWRSTLQLEQDEIPERTVEMVVRA